MSRLSDERLNEIYLGTLMLVAKRGFDNFTMDQVAEATRASKATLYRQWGSKTALVVEALVCGNSVPEVAPDTGSLRGDLRELFTPHDKEIDEVPELIGAILHAMKQNAELADAVRTQIIGPVNDQIDIFLQRAIERGEVAADCPAIAHIHLVVLAPFVLQGALTGIEHDPDHIYDYLDGLVLPALGIH